MRKCYPIFRANIHGDVLVFHYWDTYGASASFKNNSGIGITCSKKCFTNKQLIIQDGTEKFKITTIFPKNVIHSQLTAVEKSGDFY